MKADCELLSQFVEDGDQEAFAEIINRHLGLVYSVALRQAAGDAHLAKDISQEVFASLARKAKQLRGRKVISGWLYYAAKFAACRTVRNESLRRKREMEAGMENRLDDPESQKNWEQARPLLDEAIGELKEADRDAICLRFYENRPFEDIGNTLDLTANTARMRVNRALEKLHGQLAKKGIKSSAATLASALGGQAATLAPAGLAQVISASAVTATSLGALLGILGIMNTTKVAILTGAVAVALGGAVLVTNNEDNTEMTSGEALQTAARTSVPELRAREIEAPDPDGIALLRRSDEGNAAREPASEKIMRDMELKLREALSNAEQALKDKKQGSSSALTPEERDLLRRFLQLRKTDPQAAQALLVGSLDESSSAAMYSSAGHTYGQDGEVDVALDFYETALEKNAGANHKVELQSTRNAGIIYVQQEKFVRSKKHLQRAIYLTEEPDSTLHGLMGLAELRTGNYAAAEYHYKQAVELDPESSYWSLGLLETYANQEKHKQSIAFVKEKLEQMGAE